MGKNVTVDLDEDAASEADAIIDEDSAASIDTDDADVIDEDLHPHDRLPDKARMNGDGSVTLALNFPVTLRTRKNGKVKERKFDELVFHRLTGKDQRVIAEAGENNLIPASFSCSTRIARAVMFALYDRMVDVDISNGGKVMNHFFASGRRTGS